MEAAMKSDDMTSVAAFVEGGVQEACDDACSICLEEFSKSDPSTVTKCGHEFHLQCILEWCQRSSNCPMCWQPVSLKDTTSQELMEGVEREKKFNSKARVLQYPSRVHFGSQHATLGSTGDELEERILQHLAATAARRRSSTYFLRDGQRNTSPSQAHCHHRPFVILESPRTSPDTIGGQRSDSARVSPRSPSLRSPHSPIPVSYSLVRPDQIHFNRTGSNVSLANRLGFLPESRVASQSSPRSPDMAGPSESLRSRLSDWSTRHRESFSRSWKERMFSRSNSSVNFNSGQATHNSDSKGSNCASSSCSD